MLNPVKKTCVKPVTEFREIWYEYQSLPLHQRQAAVTYLVSAALVIFFIGWLGGMWVLCHLPDPGPFTH